MCLAPVARRGPGRRGAIPSPSFRDLDFARRGGPGVHVHTARRIWRRLLNEHSAAVAESRRCLRGTVQAPTITRVANSSRPYSLSRAGRCATRVSLRFELRQPEPCGETLVCQQRL